MTCRRCGAAFEANHHGRPRQYCSERCKRYGPRRSSPTIRRTPSTGVGPARPASCHGDREAIAKGLCRQCYDRVRRSGMTRDQAGTLDDVGPCAICGIVGVRVFDHDHATGEMRGMICRDCNCAIGYLGDDPTRAENAARYLRNPLAHASRLRVA